MGEATTIESVGFNRRPFLAPLLLAVLWGIGPALPALLRGELLGHGYTDLFPSVWGLWLFSEAQPGLPDSTLMLGHPEGMGFVYSSPIKGWLATLLIPLFGLANTWNILLIAARIATVVTSWMAARAWGLGPKGALTAAAVYGCSPFFQGYAVEGIVEGTDGWTLALWAWALGVGRLRLSAVFLALTIWSSWYLGICACLLTALASLEAPKRLWSFAGLVLVVPIWWKFSGAFPDRIPLPDEIRSAMGATLQIPEPGFKEGLNFSAMTTWIGSITLAAAMFCRRRWLWLVPLPALLSLGIGPVYELPLLDQMRFPYRWHAATLALLALCAGATADRFRVGWLIGPVIVVEGLFTSPIEPLIPGSDPSIPTIYAQVDSPLLEVPGPVMRPPGEINPSRPRARYLLYYQAFHQQPSPWVPDFNSIGVDTDSEILLPFQSHDRVEDIEHIALLPEHLDSIREAGIRQIMIHRCEMGDCNGTRNALRLQLQLEALGATVVDDDGERCLMWLP